MYVQEALQHEQHATVYVQEALQHEQHATVYVQEALQHEQHCSTLNIQLPDIQVFVESSWSQNIILDLQSKKVYVHN